MTSKIILTVGTGLFSLALINGAADAAKGGSSNNSSSNSSSSRVSEARKVETREVKTAPKFTPKAESKVVDRIVSKPIDPRVTTPVLSNKKIDPRVTTPVLVKKHDTQADKSKVLPTGADKLGKVALNPQPLPPKAGASLTSKVALGAVAAGGAYGLSRHAANLSQLPKQPLMDRQKNISSASMQKFVTANAVMRNAQTFSPKDGTKHFAAIKNAQTLIKDPTKGYKVATYGDKKHPEGKPAGDNSTIVINGHNKTVYVPASQVSGPDNRKIIINCDHCKVVVVGATSVDGKPVVDNRQIVVNGDKSKIVLQSDKATGGAGQNGGTVTDNRHVTVSGDKNKIKVEGDNVNGGSGANSTTGRGQDGGNGGKITDNRTVDFTKESDKNKVILTGDTANGGNGGNGKGAGGNGGTGGDVSDKRQVNDQGDGNKVKNNGGDSANGGNGGNGSF